MRPIHTVCKRGLVEECATSDVSYSSSGSTKRLRVTDIDKRLNMFRKARVTHADESAVGYLRKVSDSGVLHRSLVLSRKV